MGKLIDFTGKRIGSFEVLEQWESLVTISKTTGKASHRAQWLCLCDCSNFKIVPRSYLTGRRGKAMCQGCAYRTRPQSTQRQDVWERLYNLIVARRGILSALSLKEFKNITTKKCHYCGDKPRRIDYLRKNKFALSEIIYINGIDRVDTCGIYEKSNCVPCCKTCNIMKNTLTKDEFLAHINKICAHNKSLDKPAAIK